MQYRPVAVRIKESKTRKLLFFVGQSKIYPSLKIQAGKTKIQLRNKTIKSAKNQLSDFFIEFLCASASQLNGIFVTSNKLRV